MSELTADPIAKLVVKWEKEAHSPRNTIHCNAVSKCADELRTAMQTRPRGSAEQVGEIERLKGAVQMLRVATVKFQSAYAVSGLKDELLDDADKTATKFMELTK